MWSKLYLALLAIALAVMAFFSYYSWSWLQSIGLPAAAVEGYEYHAGLFWIFLWASSIVLLIVGNVMLWLTRNAWAMWATLLYFAVFMLLTYFWLGETAFNFKKQAGLGTGGFSLGPLLGVIFVIGAAVLIFLNQFMVVQLQRKMYPPVVEPEADTETETIEKAEE